jgi:hypothetical protein
MRMKSGDERRRGGTKSGDEKARRAVVEAAMSHDGKWGSGKSGGRSGLGDLDAIGLLEIFRRYICWFSSEFTYLTVH